MHHRVRLAMVAGFSVVLSALVGVVPAYAAAPGATVTVESLVHELRVEAPATVPYDRELFFEGQRHPDGCYTRAKVLIEESTTPTTRSGTCTITSGSWTSYYDGATYSDPTLLEMDHLVALKETWVSGAWGWSDAQRAAYANDLGFAPTLVMVTAAVNSAKSDKDPARWMPSASATCRYLSDWVAVKARWNLSIDATEKSAILSALAACPALTVAAPPSAGIDAPQGGRGTPAFADGVTRLSGADRYATSVKTAQQYAPGVAAVFVATGTNFPDALSAASAAALLGGPLLLTPAQELPATVLAEVRRLAPSRVYVVGGPQAVSDKVVTALSTVATTTRVGGADRYETGLNIVNSVFSTSRQAIIATGSGFADALAASGAAGAVRAPVILVNGSASTTSAATLGTLRRLGVTTVGIAGGPNAVSEGIAAHLRQNGFSVSRHGGADRYETSAVINAAYFPAGATTTFVATGTNFPDALSGAALAGRLGAPLFSTAQACTPASVHNAITATGATKHVVMGGPNAVSDNAARNAMCVSTPAPPAPAPPAPAPPGPVVSNPVTPGAFCAKSVAGWYGHSAGGVLMQCKTSATDSRLRWRQA